MSTSTILQTRLRPPRLPAGHLVRRALLDQVLGGLEGRLVLVVAGPGYGKTTLLAQAVEAADDPWVWLTLDARLTDPGLIVAHLIGGLAERFPGVGAGLDLAGPPEAQIASLSNEIGATVADELILVLDDVHHLAEGPASGVVTRLLADLPANVHLALVGRQAPEFPHARLLAAGAILEVGEESLAFTAGEAAALLSAAGLVISPDEATELHRRTEGWPAGLLIAARAGSNPGAQVPARRDAALFDYFAEEVLERQPAQIQDFLVASALPERFDADLANALTGSDQAEALIARLVNEHLFVTRLAGEGEWYRYHPLLREYLLERLATLGPAEVATRHRLLAVAWESRGASTDAVVNYLAAGESDEAARVLEPVAELIALTPQASALASWLGALPAEYLAARPRLLLAQATLFFGRGDYPTALATIERAIDRLLETGDHERAAESFSLLVWVLGAAAGGGREHALQVSEHVLPRIDRSASGLPRAYANVAAIEALSGRYAESGRSLAVAADLPASGSPPSLAHIGYVTAFFALFPQGRLRLSASTFDATVERFASPGADPAAFLPFALWGRGFVHSELGAGELALADADRMEEAARQRGVFHLQIVGIVWLRMCALACLERWNDLDIVRGYAESVFSPGGPGVGHRQHYFAIVARLAANRGDAEGVAASVQTARTEARQNRSPFEESLVLADASGAAIDVGLTELAAEVAEEAVRIADGVGATWGVLRGSVVAAAALGPGPGDPHLQRALTLTEDLNDVDALWTRRERRHVAPLLTRALVADIGPSGTAERLALACGGEVLGEVLDSIAIAPPVVRERLARRAETAAGAQASMLKPLESDVDPTVRTAATHTAARLRARPRSPVEITTLGRLEMHRGGVAVPLSGLRPKVRSLLGVFLSEDDWVHRERILAWLWSDADPDRALASFQTTLWALRRALEPDAERSDQQLVVADGERYRLALTTKDRLDARAILATAAGTEMSLDALIEAASRYGGPFCPEWPYEPWAEARRAQIEAAYDDVLVRLGERFVAAERAGEAIAPLRTLVARVPESERAQRALMRAYAGAGERALALRQFHACRALLRQRLGVEPSNETRGLYSSLL